MRHILVLLGVCMFLSVRGAEAQPSYPFQDSTLTVEARLNDLVERMTLEEKIDLLAGYEDFYLHPCERLGIPAFKMADGPLGVSSWGIWGRATAFPAALATILPVVLLTVTTFVLLEVNVTLDASTPFTEAFRVVLVTL